MSGETLALVVFRLETEEYAVPVAQVREVLPVEGITRVPRAAPEVQGVMNVRGHILTVVDLRRRLGLSPRPVGEAARVMVMTPPVGSEVGVVVDEVLEVLRIPDTAIEPAPPMVVTDATRAYVLGVARPQGRLILVCDLVAIVRPEQRPAPRGAA